MRRQEMLKNRAQFNGQQVYLQHLPQDGKNAFQCRCEKTSITFHFLLCVLACHKLG